MDSEILKFFPNFNIERADRNTEFDLTDEYQLQSHGGCLLLASPDIIVVPKISYSNGNCEMLIVECPNLKTAIIIIYRPPNGPNFTLRKFSEIISKVQKYLHELTIKGTDLSIILTGDFNFPERVVSWISSEEGVIADAKEGSSEEKTAFKLLMDLANDYKLEQLVDKPT